MYTIGNIIYGIPLTEELERALDKCGIEEVECVDFNTYYSGHSDYTPGYLGVELKRFDECSGNILLSELDVDLSGSQRKEVEKLVNALPERIEEYVDDDPEVGDDVMQQVKHILNGLKIDKYIIWSTS